MTSVASIKRCLHLLTAYRVASHAHSFGQVKLAWPLTRSLMLLKSRGMARFGDEIAVDLTDLCMSTLRQTIDTLKSIYNFSSIYIGR